MSLYVGIDNGVTGAIAGIMEDGAASFFFPTPVFKEQDYIKEARTISRIDTPALLGLLPAAIGCAADQVRVVMERPMVNPGRFVQSGIALRAHEATLIVREKLGYVLVKVIDSREWQKELLPAISASVPKAARGKLLKTMSKDMGKRLFPACAATIDKQGDADALLIAEYARRKKL